MLLFTCANKGGTHGTRQCLSTCTNAVAHFNRPAKSVLTGEIEVSINLNGAIICTKAEVLCHGWGINNFTRIHNAVRIKRFFHFNEGLIYFWTEHALYPLTTDEPVTVFTAHGTI